jgi:hypothetical protein
MKPGCLFDPVPDVVEMPSPVAVELKRRHAAADRVLARLEQGPATNVELCDKAIGGMRAIGGRMHDLRKKGYQFGKRHIEGGIYEYWLVRKSGE